MPADTEAAEWDMGGEVAVSSHEAADVDANVPVWAAGSAAVAEAAGTAAAVTAVAGKIFKAFDSDNKKHTFLHGHSYTGNTLACAAANANLDLFEKEDTQKNIKRIVGQQADFIKSIKSHPKLRDARNFGTIAAIELGTEG